MPVRRSVKTSVSACCYVELSWPSHMYLRPAHVENTQDARGLFSLFCSRRTASVFSRTSQCHNSDACLLEDMHLPPTIVASGTGARLVVVGKTERIDNRERRGWGGVRSGLLRRRALHQIHWNGRDEGGEEKRADREMVSRGEVEAHIKNGTFMTFLESHVVITPHKKGDALINLEIEFPEWFSEYFDETNQREIIDLIRRNAKDAFGTRDGFE